jgi:hypothetical protein
MEDAGLRLEAGCLLNVHSVKYVPLFAFRDCLWFCMGVKLGIWH